MQQFIALILTGLFSLPLFAEADGPDYWRVSGVSDGNVLNIRSSANIKAARIGQIPSAAQCVKNRGCEGGLTYAEFTTLTEAEKRKTLKQRPRWCRISYQGMNGWVAGHYLRESHCSENESRSTTFIDPLNHAYLIDGEVVNLIQGSARSGISGTTASIITEAYKTNTVFVDLTGDDRKDAVQVLVQQTGGSGSFYYLSLAASDGSVIDSFFLGDRIKIQSIQVINNKIVVAYLIHGKTQAMSERPAVSVDKSFILDGEKLVESSDNY